MRKNNIIISILSIFMVLVGLLEPTSVNAGSNADTLAELRKELSTYKAKKASADAAKNKTKNEISISKNNISAAQAEIEANQNKINEAKKQITKLEKEISLTKNRINDIINSYQIMGNENAYLEYIFGAKNISDFFIRLNVSSQILEYNSEQMRIYESNIEENKQLQIDLTNREEKLNSQIVTLENEIDNLGSSLTSYIAEANSAQDDINSTQKLIDYYVSLGCGENQSLASCVQLKGDTKFIKPLNKGTITSYYGYRTHPVTGVINSFHTGLDLAGNPEGTNVYAAANGVVGKIITRSSCGGNQVYVHHYINGVKYTTLYMHLLNISVKLGDNVTTNTVVGHVGGYSTSSSHGGYDTCTTGAHLHFSIAKGWYGSTYVTYSNFVSNLIDPRSQITFPTSGKYFYTRF